MLFPNSRGFKLLQTPAFWDLIQAIGSLKVNVSLSDDGAQS